MVCLLLAAQEAGVPVDAIVLKRNMADDLRSTLVSDVEPRVERATELTPGTLERLRSGPVFVFIGGTYHMRFGLHPHPRPFDLVLPDAPDLPLDPGAEIIPAAAVQEMINRNLARHFTNLARVTDLAEGPVYHFECPPPPSEAWVRAKQVYKMNRGKHPSMELAPPFLRYKLWCLSSEISRTYAEQLGAEFVARPDAAVDEDGFLLSEYCRNATHATSAYGALLLEQVKTIASAFPTTRPAFVRAGTDG